ncbi:MAG: ketoacid CoA transferase [Deltaproteobacteria bacterium]|nr:ketoacid CoA transferase [Deltaproteobacteria bacterium]
MSGYTKAELCIVAAAEAFRGDGEVLASGMGLVPRLAAGLAKLTFSPDLLLNDAECTLVSQPISPGPRTGELAVEGWLPFRKVFELLWSGRRHTMNMPTQLDRLGYCNISRIGPVARPKTQLLGVRGIPGNTINHPCSYFVPNHSRRTIVERVDMASGVGHDPERWRPGVKKDFVDLRRAVTNLGVFDFEGPGQSMRLLSVHPWSSEEEIQKETAFPLARADVVHETPAPTAEQLRLIRDVLDPNDLRATALG